MRLEHRSWSEDRRAFSLERSALQFSEFCRNQVSDGNVCRLEADARRRAGEITKLIE